MPQLDKQTFFFQYFWLTIFFFFLYFIILNLFVHTVFRVRKVYNHVNRFWSFFFNNFNTVIYDNVVTENSGNCNAISVKLVSGLFFQLCFKVNQLYLKFNN